MKKSGRREDLSGLEEELGGWPSTKAVGWGTGIVLGSAAAANQLCADYSKNQIRQKEPPISLSLGQLTQVQMVRQEPAIYYGGRALLNPCAAPAGLVAALLLTAAYAGAKRAYTNLRQFLTQHR